MLLEYWPVILLKELDKMDFLFQHFYNLMQIWLMNLLIIRQVKH